MKILSCETSTLMGSVALSEGGRVLAARRLERNGSHTDSVNGMIRECLTTAKCALTDVDVFATGVGPGSFTGIRISLNTIKTFGYVFNKPVAGFDSLEIMAYQVFEAQKDNHPTPSWTSVSVMLNAFKNMVYFAEYEVVSGHLNIIKEPQVLRVQSLEQILNPTSLVVGDGFPAYASFLERVFEGRLLRSEINLDFPLAETCCKMFSVKKNQHWSELKPLYLRASEAEENLKGIKFQPL